MKDAVVVAGEGLAVLEAATGQTRWSAPEARATAPPIAWGAWLFVGEADGSPRCRDLATGAVLWSYKTTHPLVAPPVVDDEGHVLLGTTDRRFMALDPRKGDVRWRWKIGGDVQAPPAVSGQHVLFTNHEDVLYALRRGNGHLAWRASLPSRPSRAPSCTATAVLVACFGSRPERRSSSASTRSRASGRGDLKAPGEVRTPPVIGDAIVIGSARSRGWPRSVWASGGRNPRHPEPHRTT